MLDFKTKTHLLGHVEELSQELLYSPWQMRGQMLLLVVLYRYIPYRQYFTASTHRELRKTHCAESTDTALVCLCHSMYLPPLTNTVHRGGISISGSAVQYGQQVRCESVAKSTS